MRSKWKPRLFKKNFVCKPGNSIKVFTKSIILFGEYSFSSFLVYNGLSFRRVQFNSRLIGFRLGELILTKKRAIFTKNKRN